MKNFLCLLALLVWSVSCMQAQSWNEIIKTVASDRATEDNYGYSVAIDGEHAVIGARTKDVMDNGTLRQQTGAVYFLHYENGSWNEIQAEIIPESMSNEQYFGFSVSISGNYALVSAPGKSSRRGSVYVYRYENGIWIYSHVITAFDAELSDEFGYSVSMSGDYAIIGSRYEDHDETGSILTKVSNAGSAYIYHLTDTTWALMQKIVASDRESSDNFGFSVSISGDYAIVGAYGEDHDLNGSSKKSAAGSAYIYHNDNGTWSEVTKIVASDRASYDNFGYNVCIDGNYAIVGARNADASAGSAYVFYNNNGSWSETQNLEPEDLEGGDLFSFAISIDGNYAVISAYRDDTDAGSLYTYRNMAGTWVQNSKVVSSDITDNDNFGFSVAMSGDQIIAGAIYENHDAAGGNEINHAGSAYFFKADYSPILAPTEVSEITEATAVSGGEIVNTFGENITAKGICWNTDGNPSTADAHTNEGTGTNTFNCNLTGLQPNTTYYVKSYATSIQGTGYGDQTSFSTPNLSVLISDVVKVNDTEYTFTSEIINPNSISITGKGFVWSINQNPDLTSNSGSISSGSGDGMFTEDASGISLGAAYYIRAYISTTNGTYYSDQIAFGTVPTLPEWGIMLLAGGFVITGGWFVFRKYM